MNFKSVKILSTLMFTGMLLIGCGGGSDSSAPKVVAVEQTGILLDTYVKAIECNKKAVGADGYYFEPKTRLEAGEYVAWIGSNFWIFKVK